MQKELRYFYVISLAMMPFISDAQTNIRGDKGERVEQAVSAPKVVKKAKISKRKPTVSKRRKVKHSPEYEYYARVEQAAKERKRMLKFMDKPQYYNPLYFGHKRPPKRNPPNKMKFCKECGIRH